MLITQAVQGLRAPASDLPGGRHGLPLQNDVSLLGPRSAAGLFNASRVKPSAFRLQNRSNK